MNFSPTRNTAGSISGHPVVSDRRFQTLGLPQRQNSEAAGSERQFLPIRAVDAGGKRRISREFRENPAVACRRPRHTARR
ncbi:MAG TPA: hypothetical protein DIT89_07485 [Planctomycetaceae bacterium]|nr:hypothetical protein [Planctomycetaceae bacterium]